MLILKVINPEVVIFRQYSKSLPRLVMWTDDNPSSSPLPDASLDQFLSLSLSCYIVHAICNIILLGIM